VLRVPAAVLRTGLGEVSSELLTGARVLSGRLQTAGFAFRYADIGGGLAAELRPGRPAA
jgi:NAD dependent epimerase/dehydratase family enzyme